MTEIRKAVDNNANPLTTLVRDASYNDMERLLELGFMQYTSERAYVTGTNFSYLSMLHAWHHLIANPETGATFVAEVDGEVQGFYAARFGTNGMDSTQITCIEVAWFVHPDHRGRGLGTALIKACQKRAFENKVTIHQVGAALTTPEINLSEWYGKLGYIPFQVAYFKVLTEEDFK